MQSLPREATPPRLEPHQVSLAPLADLGPALVDSDALVTELDVAEIALAAHSSEFVELCSLRIHAGGLADSDWYRTNWVDVELHGVDAANASFIESGMKRISWRASRMVGMAQSGCTLADVAHQDCSLSMANFRHASLSRVAFEGCDLTGADFSGARLQEVTFTDCRLDGATFFQAQSSRVVVNGGSLAGLTGLDGLKGATFRVGTVAEIAREMALALGFELIEG